MEQQRAQHAAAQGSVYEQAGYAVIGALGVLLWWLSAHHPARLPFWLPWEFSPSEYLVAALVSLWFCRGLAAAPAAERPPVWRRALFLVGLAIIYAVLQTRYDYLAQHMFFLHRIQHVVMHHLGPFLIALGGAGGTLRRGMPRWAQRVVASRVVTATIAVLQRPWLAALLFVGLIYFWLVPPIHFRAMIDWRLYAVMNWSMVLDGVLFWSLVLDPRPAPPARVSYGARVALALGVIFPQIALGATIAFSNSDLYPYYDLCGRLLPSIGALEDQHIGGIVIWIPPAMMGALAVLLVMNALRIHEDAASEKDRDAATVLASSWTGR
ncbi:MAG: cytochrome c oxidase assembly protein [Stellaceae bacterium]